MRKANQTAYLIASAARAPGGVITWAEARALYLEASARAGAPHTGFNRNSYSSPLRQALKNNFVQVLPDAEEGTQATSMARSFFVLRSMTEDNAINYDEDLVELGRFQADHVVDEFGMSVFQIRTDLDRNLNALKRHMASRQPIIREGLVRMSDINPQQEEP